MTDKLLRIPETKLNLVGAILDRQDWSAFDQLLEPSEAGFARDALEGVFAEGLLLFPDPKEYGELDSFLSTRIHLCIRIPRSVASDPGIWCWLAGSVGRNYMLHRWPQDPGGNWWRYNSNDVLRNGIARLWWAAELVRSGPDYSLVPKALATVRTFQNVSELRYSWHRECARAITRVLSEHKDAGDQLGPSFNAYLKTQSLERFDTDFDDKEQRCWDPVWGAKLVKKSDVLLPFDEIQLTGPSSGYSRIEVEEALVEWLEDLYSQLRDASDIAAATTSSRKN